MTSSNTWLGLNEIFETIQGEATYTGTPSVFVRLQGCPVGCGWCDTKHTWQTNAEDQTEDFESIVNKVKDSPKHVMVTSSELAGFIEEGYNARHVVITGGEPCLYDLEEFTTRILLFGSVQIETSGTFPIKAHPKAWVTLSPKLDMAGGLKVLEENYYRANEIKFPVGKIQDVDKMLTRIPIDVLKTKPIWLQPLSQSKKATKLCIEIATMAGFKISVQTHKYIEVR